METTRIRLKIYSLQFGAIERGYDIPRSRELGVEGEKNAILHGLEELREAVDKAIQRMGKPKEGQILLGGKPLTLPPWDPRRQKKT